MTGERSDSDLVSEYLETGEPALFESLVRRHWDRIVRVVFSIIGPEHSMYAEDLAQQTVIRAHETLGAFRGEARFTTWIYRIAHNQAIDHARRASRRSRLLHAASPPPEGEPIETPDDRAIVTERSLLVQRTLTRVPQPYQAALRLYYWFDLPVQEVAVSLGVANGTAKSYLHRGRIHLHRLLEENEVSP